MTLDCIIFGEIIPFGSRVLVRCGLSDYETMGPFVLFLLLPEPCLAWCPAPSHLVQLHSCGDGDASVM